MLKEKLKSLGASLVGFADLTSIEAKDRCGMDYGIAIAIALSKEVVRNIDNGPTKEYYDEYNRINAELDSITEYCEKYIKSLGYDAIGQTTTYVTEDESLSTLLPHKTVATRAGLGWIGKSALLVTSEYGSAVRISSVLTNMPLEVDKPINESRCGKCTECTKACPAAAIKGRLWDVNTSREELVDPYKCRHKGRELLKNAIGIEMTLCGKCIEVCPYVKKYLKL